MSQGLTANVLIGDTAALMATAIDTSNTRADGVTAHFQSMSIAYGGGTTMDLVSTSKPFPVDVMKSTAAATILNRLDSAITSDLSSGGTAWYVRIDDSSGITVTANFSENVGITGNYDFAQVFVKGIPGATAINITGTAGSGHVGITGSVLVQGYGATGNAVAVTGAMKILPVQASLPVAGTGAGGHVGVTGTVLVQGYGATGNAVSVTGGVFAYGGGQGTTAMPVIPAQPTGLTAGMTKGDFRVCRSFPAHGLSSGVRISAYSTGVSTDFVYVGGQSGGGTASMYPLRDFQTFGDSVFMEIDNMSKLFIGSDNSNANIRYLGS